MRPIVTDGVAWSVSRSVVIMSPAKRMAELNKVHFGTLTRVGPRNCVLDGGPDPLAKAAILWGKWGSPL